MSNSPLSRKAYNDGHYQRLRPVVLAEAGYQCEVRGPLCIGRATTVDHVLPIIDGGTAERSNLRAACRPCNSSLGAQVQAARRQERTIGKRSRRW